MKRMFQVCSLSLFAVILAGVLVWSLVSPDKQMSLLENRTLQQLPDWESETLESYAGKLTAYAADQFPARSYWVTLDTAISVFSGRWLVRDNYLVDGGWIIPRASDASGAEIREACRAIGDLCAAYPEISFCYAMLPYKSLTLAEALPAYVDSSPVMRNRQAIAEALPTADNFTYVDAASLLREATTVEQRQALFFRTDFHWNARGAALGTELLLEAMEEGGLLASEPRLSYTIELLEGKRYLGDLNRQLSYLVPAEEEIPVICPDCDVSAWRYYLHPGNGTLVERREITGSGADKAAVSYNDIYTENLGYYRVENSQAASDQRILIFKDSYENPVTDLLAMQFAQVTVVDPRYYAEDCTIDELIAQEQPDLVLFFYNENSVGTWES